MVSANPQYTRMFKSIPCLKVERKQDTNYLYDNVDVGMIILIIKLNLSFTDTNMRVTIYTLSQMIKTQ